MVSHRLQSMTHHTDVWLIAGGPLATLFVGGGPPIAAPCIAGGPPVAFCCSYPLVDHWIDAVFDRQCKYINARFQLVVLYIDHIFIDLIRMGQNTPQIVPFSLE